MGPFAVVSALVAVGPLPSQPVSPERLAELLHQLQKPNWEFMNGQQAPLNDFPPVRGFRPQNDAMTALWWVGPQSAGPLIEIVGDVAKHPQARANAAYLLTWQLAGVWTTPDPRVLDCVRAALKDPDPAVREWTVKGVGSMGANWYRGKPPAAAPVTRAALCPAAHRALLPAVAAALADPDAEVAYAAAAAVKWCGRPGEGVTELLVALKRKESKVRAEALSALTEVGRDDPEALAAVLKELEHPTDAECFGIAVWAVGHFGLKAKPALPKLIAVLNDKRDRDSTLGLRGSAVWSLGKIGPAAKEAVPLILEYARGPTRGVGHSEIVAALANIDPAAAEQAREEYRERTEAFRRQYEAMELRDRMTPPALPVLGTVQPPPP